MDERSRATGERLAAAGSIPSANHRVTMDINQFSRASKHERPLAGNLANEQRWRRPLELRSAQCCGTERQAGLSAELRRAEQSRAELS